MEMTGIAPFNIMIYRVIYIISPLFKCSLEERDHVLCNIIAIREKNMVPSTYYIFNKYLLTDYMVGIVLPLPYSTKTQPGDI